MELYTHPQHIGDGVYASTDGYQIWLMTQEGHRIALEPAVFRALVVYEQFLRELKSAAAEPSA